MTALVLSLLAFSLSAAACDDPPDSDAIEAAAEDTGSVAWDESMSGVVSGVSWKFEASDTELSLEVAGKDVPISQTDDGFISYVGSYQHWRDPALLAAMLIRFSPDFAG